MASKTAQLAQASAPRLQPRQTGRKFFRRLGRELPYHIMVWMGLLFVFIFNYIPMPGIIIAFKDYSIRDGIWGSPWVGLAHFKNMFGDYFIRNALLNTVGISVLSLCISFPLTILFALLLNELQNKLLQRTVQTISFLPHFISWAVMAVILTALLSPSDGILSGLLTRIGLMDEMTYIMGDPKYYWIMVVLAGLWKEYGWNSIVYLAVLSGVDSTLYEAARIDGASRWQQIRHISLPSLKGIISITLILRIAGCIGSGFEQAFYLSNALNYERSNVLAYYTYQVGLANVDFSYSTAISLVFSVIGALMMLSGNAIVKKINGEGVY